MKPQAQPARVLVIEDNPANLYLMRYLIAAAGHEVETAGRGDSGLARILEGGLDLVICDLQLPGIDGMTLMRKLKTTKHPPTVAVTALAMVGDRDRILAAGFDGYLSKPIDPHRFVGQIEAYLPDAKRRGAPKP